MKGRPLGLPGWLRAGRHRRRADTEETGGADAPPTKPTLLLSAFNRAKCVFLCAAGHLHQQSLFFEHGWLFLAPAAADRAEGFKPNVSRRAARVAPAAPGLGLALPLETENPGEARAGEVQAVQVRCSQSGKILVAFLCKMFS